jgi:hypothetical protein
MGTVEDSAGRGRLDCGLMARFVAFRHEKGEVVLVNPDHVVMVFGHIDVSTLMLSNEETIPVRGTLKDVQRLLNGEDVESLDQSPLGTGPRAAPGR